MPPFVHLNPSLTSVGLSCSPEDYASHCLGQTLRVSRFHGRIQLVSKSAAGKTSCLDLAYRMLGCPVGFRVKYVDGNSHNLERENLHLVERWSGKRPACGVQGVTKATRPAKRPFLAHFKRDGKRVFVGSFLTPEEAAAALLVAKTEYVHACSARTPWCSTPTSTS